MLRLARFRACVERNWREAKECFFGHARKHPSARGKRLTRTKSLPRVLIVVLLWLFAMPAEAGTGFSDPKTSAGRRFEHCVELTPFRETGFGV